MSNFLANLMPGKCVMVHPSIANKAAVKSFCAEHGFSVVVSQLVPVGQFYVYDPEGKLPKSPSVSPDLCVRCDYLDVPCQEHAVKQTTPPFIRHREPGILRLLRFFRRK